MITFERVHFNVGNTAILKNINGQLTKHAITSLIGPSGAGKTTLLKMCNALLSPTAGTATRYDERVNYRRRRPDYSRAISNRH